MLKNPRRPGLLPPSISYNPRHRAWGKEVFQVHPNVWGFQTVPVMVASHPEGDDPPTTLNPPRAHPHPHPPAPQAARDPPAKGVETSHRELLHRPNPCRTKTDVPPPTKERGRTFSNTLVHASIFIQVDSSS